MPRALRDLEKKEISVPNVTKKLPKMKNINEQAI